MINLNITLKFIDSCCNNCFKNSIEKEIAFTSITMQSEVQEGYLINVLSQDTLTCTIIIQNGQNVIIRKLLYNVETKILLPSSLNHIITITALN